MKKVFNFTMILLFAISFTACVKKADPTPQQLINGKWKIVTYTATSGSITQAAPACEMDNIWEFAESIGNFSDTKNVVCRSSEPTVEAGTFSISADGKTLTISPIFSSSKVWNILELTNSSLKLSLTGINAAGAAVTGNITLSKI